MTSSRHSPATLALGAVLLGVVSLLPSTAGTSAREYHYGAFNHSALLDCEQPYWHGERPAAINCYESLVRDLSLPPQIRAEAMWALGNVRGANRLFQTAVEDAPENARIRVRWGELFLQTWQNQEALNLFDEALDIEPDNAWAHVGAIEALEGSDPQVINEHMSAIMDNFATPPGARLRAMLHSLHMTLERDDLDEAAEKLADIRELAEEEDLPTMEVDAYAAALAFLRHEDPTPFIETALSESPGYGDAWAIPAYFASITRRYDQAGEFFDHAVEIQPDHWEAHVQLGQNHLRLNRVDAAIEHIERAYEGDPYNPRTVNLLRLLDTFTEEFVVLNFPDPPEGPLPELSLRLHEDEQAVLAPYARQLAEDSIDLYTERYRFEPREPIIIEIFPNHEDFVVRSIGMPGVGILGVTFGYLFAMDSPTGHPEESYHWGTTLWHEMAHVFTVEASDHLVPRWFSEGMSVYEEWVSGPIPGRKIPLDVLQAMADDKFLPISELDDGFMRPTYEGQVMVSYMQSGLVFQYLDEAFGYDKAVDMLYLFPDGIRANAALQQVLGIDMDTLESGFQAWLDTEFGELLPSLEQFSRHQAAAFEALQAEEYEQAVAAAQSATEIYPAYAEVDSPWVALARAHRALGNEEDEFLALESYWEAGGWSPRALLNLGDDYLLRGQQHLAERVLMDANWADPFNEDLHRKLGDLYLELDKPEQALVEYEVLLALDPLDKASAHYRLATAHDALGNDDQTMDAVMTALDIAPQFRPAQQLLLDLSRRDEQ